jgi:hypothetical protein
MICDDHVQTRTCYSRLCGMNDATNWNLQYHTRIITNIHRKHRICELCLMWLGASVSSSSSNDYSSSTTESIGRKWEQGSRRRCIQFTYSSSPTYYFAQCVTEKYLLRYYKSKNCLKPRRPRFDLRSGHVRCQQVALEQVFSEYFSLLCQYSFHPLLPIHSLSQYRRYIVSIMSASLNNQLLKTVSTMSFMNNLDITK